MASMIAGLVLIVAFLYWHKKGGWRQKVEVGFKREYTLFGWPTGFVVGTGTWWLTPFPGIVSLLKPVDCRSKTISGRDINDIWVGAERKDAIGKGKEEEIKPQPPSDDGSNENDSPQNMNLLAHLRIKFKAIADLQFRVGDVHVFQQAVNPDKLEELLASRMAHHIRQAFISMHPVVAMSKTGQSTGTDAAEGALRREMKEKGIDIEKISLISLNPTDPKITALLEALLSEEIQVSTEVRDTQTVVEQAETIVRGMGLTDITKPEYQSAVERQVLVILTTRAQLVSAEKGAATVIPPGAVQINLGGNR